MIGCGGISRGTDVIEMAMAGASVVQVCTAAILRGHAVFGKIAGEVAAWLGAHGYASLDEVRGAAGREPVRAQAPGPPVVDVDLCNGCALCVGWCVYDAIHVVGGKAVVDEDRCELCGLCLTRCRPGALMWAPPLAPSRASRPVGRTETDPAGQAAQAPTTLAASGSEVVPRQPTGRSSSRF